MKETISKQIRKVPIKKQILSLLWKREEVHNFNGLRQFYTEGLANNLQYVDDTP